MLSENPIVSTISAWFRRNFSDPDALGLFFTVVLLVVLIECFGRVLAPILVSVVLAYMLLSSVRRLVTWHCPHLLAVILTYLLFLGLLIWAVLGLVPLLIDQLTNLVNEIPALFNKAQAVLVSLMRQYPHIFSAGQWQSGVAMFKDQFASLGKIALSFSLSSLNSMISVVLYCILVPLMTFFFLKDSGRISTWGATFLPSNRSLVKRVWGEVNSQIGNYIRGRIIEIVIVSIVSVVTFSLFGLPYAVLLGVLVGVSVIVPYVGAVLVTIPIVIMSLISWGWSAHLAYAMLAYVIIIVLDANLLVPWLFSETMDLHPLAIIIAVLVFGGIWGFWGVFLAIPLATLVKAILEAWPRV